jgi:hypothetical protein
MPDGDMPGERPESILSEDVRNTPHARIDSDLFPIGRGDTGAFLAAVLEGKECEKGKTGYILVGCIDTKNAARFVQDYPAFKLILTDSAI